MLIEYDPVLSSYEAVTTTHALLDVVSVVKKGRSTPCK
jgi:hypothetical protein